ARPQVFHHPANCVQKLSRACAGTRLTTTRRESQSQLRKPVTTQWREPCNPSTGMRYENSRRCALWVSPRIFVEAEKLAHSIGLDVDTFIEGTVLALLEKQGTDGAPGTRARAEKSPSTGHVISMADWSSWLRRSG